MRRLISPLLALLLVAARVMSLPAQKPAAKTPAEQTLRELVQLLNAGERTAIRAFVTERFVAGGPNGISVDDRTDRLAGLHGQLGTITVRTFNQPRPNEGSSLVQVERTESWRRLTL